jgi:membrane protein YdbS with pleckstrin-like domain
MEIKPSVRGFYIKRYATMTAAAIIILFAGLFIFLNLGFLAIFAIACLLSAIMVALGILHAALHRSHTSLHILNDSLVYEHGVLSHQKTSVPLDMITDSTTRRSFLDKIIGVSTLSINTSGTGEREIIAEDFEAAGVEKMSNEIHRLIREIHHGKKAPAQPAPKV